MNDLTPSAQDNLTGTVQAFFSIVLAPFFRSIDAMAIDLSKLTLDVDTLHKLATDQHDLLATLRTQLDAALAAVHGPSIQIDTATQAAIDALDTTIRDAGTRLSATMAPPTPPAPIASTTPAPAPSGAPTGVEVAAKPD